MLTLLTTLALELAALAAAAPTKVASVRFEDLVRYSDLIVVGSVVRIDTLDSHARPRTDPELLFDRLPPKVPFAELAVQRVLKGEPTVERVVYLATGTWTCDITSAELGERVLLFLSTDDEGKLIEPELRAEVTARFPGSVRASILWSGRGRMPVDVRKDGEYATYWADDVILPEGFPSVPGPEPEYDFIRSAHVSDFAQRIQGLLESQRKTWVRASVTEPWGDTLAWNLDIAWDRGVRLLIHEAAGDREALFRLTLEQTLELQHELRQIGRPVRESFGSGTPRLGVRTLSVLDPEAPLKTSLHLLDDRTLDPAGWREVFEVLELWSRLRGYFEEPTCADHRKED